MTSWTPSNRSESSLGNGSWDDSARFVVLDSLDWLDWERELVMDDGRWTNYYIHMFILILDWLISNLDFHFGLLIFIFRTPFPPSPFSSSSSSSSSSSLLLHPSLILALTLWIYWMDPLRNTDGTKLYTPPSLPPQASPSFSFSSSPFLFLFFILLTFLFFKLCTTYLPLLIAYIHVYVNAYIPSLIRPSPSPLFSSSPLLLFSSSPLLLFLSWLSLPSSPLLPFGFPPPSSLPYILLPPDLSCLHALRPFSTKKKRCNSCNHYPLFEVMKVMTWTWYVNMIVWWIPIWFDSIWYNMKMIRYDVIWLRFRLMQTNDVWYVAMIEVCEWIYG